MPNRKVVMEKSKQDKVNTLIAKHIDKVSDLSRSQSKVILNHDDRIKDVVKSVKFLAMTQVATLVVLGLIHAQHSGWFDNVGWLQ
tara:strand:+ start:292 stop:546 length:255 start_codon:yes stop_codon:yes gene_type:complete